MAENLVDESVQVTEQPKPQKPASYISGLRDNLVHFYGENNVPDEASFTKKITSDAEYLKGVHANLIHAYGEENVPDINAFSDKVKKKDQTGLPTAQISGEVSAPTTSQLTSPSKPQNVTDWYKQNMPDAMFVKPISESTKFNKPKEMAEDVLYKAAAPAREAKKKADTDIAIKNTAENYFKNNNIDAPEGSPLFNNKVQDLKNKVYNGDVVLGIDKTNNKLGLKKTTGFWESLQNGFSDAINANDEASSFVGMTPEQKVQWLKDKSKTNIGEEGYIGKTPSKLGAYGEFLGGATPMMAKTIAGTTVGAGLAAAAPETGGLSLEGLPAVMAWAFNAQDMASQGAQKEILRRYDMIKTSKPNVSDIDAMKEASSGQTLGEIAGLAENTAFMMPAARAIAPEAKSVLRSGVENTLKSAIHTGGIVSGIEAGKKVVAGAEGYGETPQQILGNGAADFAENATVGGLLHISTMAASGLLDLPKVLQSSVKYALKDVPKQDIDNVLKANVNIGNIPADLAEKVSSDIDSYKIAADKAMPGLSPEAEAAQIGLIQKKDKLTEEARTKDDSVKPVYKEQIESIDNKINDLNKGKPVYDVETDELTGHKYNKDKSTDYISFEELPKEEVKPTQVNAQSEIENIAANLSKDEFLSKTHDLPLEGLDPGFNEATKNKFLSRKSRNPEAPIRLGFRDGKVTILDGAHRYYEAVERGDKTIKANFAYGEGADKFYDKIKTKENAIQEPSTGEVLQRPQEGIGETGGEHPRVEPSIQGTEIAKEGKQAKVNEEKVLSSKGLKAAETRKINQEASNIEATDSRSAALKYLSGANLSQDAINEIAGRVKRAELNTGRREFKTQEVKLRDYVAKKGEGESLDEAAHSIWDNMSEEMQSKNTTQDVKEALMQAVLEHTTKTEAAKALIDGYKETNFEDAERKHYEKYADENPDKMDAEMAKLEESISKLEEDDNYEFEYPEEHINNIISQYEKESETKVEQPTEGDKGKSTEEISSGEVKPENERKAEAGIITHAANAETREKLGLEQPELLSNLTEKERYDKAQEMLKKGYDINKLIDKMYNPEEVLNPVENAISNLYKQSLISELEKGTPSNEDLILAKRFLDARDQANSRAGAALQSLKGEAPKVTILDFYVNKMEDNNTDILTDKQKEEAKSEYEAIKAKLDIIEAKNKELEKINSELLAKKEIDSQKGIKKTKEKRDYTSERKEVIDSIREKLKKARTGQGGLTAVPIPYAAELAAIAPDVAKLVKLYVEEGAEKLEDVVSKIYDVLKDEIKGLQKKDVQDVIAGQYGKPSKEKTEIENKINDLKTEAKLINKIEEARQLKPRTEKEKVEQNKTLTDLRKELNKVRKETGYYDESKLKSLIDKNNKESEKLRTKLEEGNFEEKERPKSFIENPEIKKKYPELYNQYLDAVDAKDEQQHQYELKRAEEQMNSLSKVEKIKAQAGKFVKEGFSTVKALKAGVDNSAVFVQNGLAVLNPMNYKATGKALLAQLQDAYSESRSRRRIVEVHENKPLWNLIKKSGLDYLDPKGYNQAMRDEQYGSTNWLERKIKVGDKEIQIAKYTTAPFERLFTSFSNEFRLQIFLRGAEQLAKEGMTIESNPKEYKDLASYVNNITGRGKIHGGLKPAEGVISNVIWAPKLLSSTLNLVGAGDLANLGKNKGYYRNMTPRMRKYAITQTAAGIGTGVALMAAYSLLPNKEVDWNPESVTFGQVKDTESGWGYNIFGRITPIVRYIAMMTMLKKKVGEGKATAVDPLKETYKFIRGKMQPTAGIVSDVMMRKDFSGKPYKLSNVPSDLFEPLFINDLRQQLAIDGVSSLLTKGIPAFYGLKVSNEKMYDKRDLKSLEGTVDSSTIDKNTLFNYNENRPVNNHEYKDFVIKRDDLLKDYYKNITENGVPVKKDNGETEVLPIDSKELTKEQLTKEINRLKGMATRNAKKDLFGLKEINQEDIDANSQLQYLRDTQGIGKQEEQNQ